MRPSIKFSDAFGRGPDPAEKEAPMCGRYTLTAEQEALQVALGVEGLVHPTPRYNIAPTQEVPVIVAPEGRLEGRTLRWGLVPSWAKDPSIGNRMINARSETAAEKPSFRGPFRRSRCLIPADGFYEWRKEEAGKVPFWIHMEDQGPFTMAGLWDRWRDPHGASLETFTILTTEPNELLRPIHDRMPVILGPEDRRAWLDPRASIEGLKALLRPHPAGPMAVREVSTRVNSPTNDDRACIQAV
jgi:putative SOS response-associated peptidase YedK